jgi:hypothetical protein
LSAKTSEGRILVSVPAQASQPPRVRPTVVTVAGWLLYLVAALQLISLVILLSQVSTIADVTEDAYRGTSAEDSARVGAVIGALGGAIIGALLAIAYVVLAIFNNRGKNPARIVTWVLGGIGVCCGTLGLIGNAVSNSFTFNNRNDNLPDPKEVQRQINDALPSWYRPTTTTLAVLALLALLAAIILLALPPANEFFRKPQAVWQPPGYPTVGYPPAGSYPPPGGYYPSGQQGPSGPPPTAPPPPGAPQSPGTPPSPPPPVGPPGGPPA